MARRFTICLAVLAMAGAVWAAARININTAGIAELTSLPRIGPRTAEAIVAYRNANGPYRSVDDLLKVPRIGPKTVANLRDLVTVTGGSSKRPPPAASVRDAPSRPAAETVPPERILPEGFCSLTCWSCREPFYLRCDLEHGFCPYCGKQWQRNTDEGNEP